MSKQTGDWQKKKDEIVVSVEYIHRSASHSDLLCPHDLQFAWNMCKVVGVGLGHELPLVWLLHKILVALLVGEIDGIFLGFELDAVAVHEVGGRLPAHERILPAVALGQDVPVHEPMRRVPVA